MSQDVNDRRAGPWTLSAGQAGPHSFDFVIRSAEDLRVTRIRAGIETELAYPADYSVTVASYPGSGSITLTALPEAGDALIVDGMRPLGSAAPDAITSRLEASPLNVKFDTAVRDLQELRRDQAGAVRAARGEAGLALPALSERVLGGFFASEKDTGNLKFIETGDLATLAGMIAQINTVADAEAEVITVAAADAEVRAVAGSIDNVDTLAPLDAALAALEPRAADLAALGPETSALVSVSGSISAVTTVAYDLDVGGHVQAVSTYIGDVQTVATHIADVSNPAQALAAGVSWGSATGDGTTTEFTLPVAPWSVDVIEVWEDGTPRARADISWTSGTTVTISPAPANAAPVVLKVTTAGAVGVVAQIDTHKTETLDPLFALKAERADMTTFHRYALARGEKIPFVVDADGTILFGFDPETGQLFIDTLKQQDLVQLQQVITDPDPIIPIRCWRDGGIALGLNAETGKLVANLDLVEVPKVQPALVEALPVADWLHIEGYGQSNSIGADATQSISTAQPYSNLTFTGGVRSESAPDTATTKPAVEEDQSGNGETSLCATVNYLSTLDIMAGGEADQVYFVSTAGEGARSIDNLSKGSAFYGHLIHQLTAAAGHAATAGQSYACPVIVFDQGEKDANDQTTKAAYKASFVQLMADVAADLAAAGIQSFEPYWLILQCSTYTQTYDQIALAQLELDEENDRVFTIAQKSDFHYTNNIHLSAQGQVEKGRYQGRAIREMLAGREPGRLKPIAAWVSQSALNTVRVKMDVPTGPLVIDGAVNGPTTGEGFRVDDDAGTPEITAVSIEGGDTVKITLSRDIDTATPASMKLRYALDYLGASLIVVDGASGNLRDSTPETVLVDGVHKAIPHAALAFEEIIRIVE